MSLKALSVERYKCFERRQELELRPITVLLGRNNSGKSALARLPLLLESGIRTTSTALVQRAMDRLRPPDRPTLEIVEQPELHLHPAAHAALADLYIAGISPACRFLIETHSETFVLRLRRRIAEGRIARSDVALYLRRA